MPTAIPNIFDAFGSLANFMKTIHEMDHMIRQDLADMGLPKLPLPSPDELLEIWKKTIKPIQ